MNAMNQIAEARASASSLRTSAKACMPEQGALMFWLMCAAESLDAMVLLAMRGVERIEQLEQEAKAGVSALMIAGGALLDTEHCELILRALDVLDRDMRTELANKGQDAAAGETRSRILIVRAKLLTMQGVGL